MGRRKRRVPKESTSVFESAPVAWCTQVASDGVDASTFESQPALSRADTSCFAEEAQCVFESNPAASVADVSSTTAAEGTSGELSVFESTPAKSSAAVTWETQVTEATDGQSVFENQPKQSGAHARSGAEGGCSDSEYTTDDSEDEN